MNIVSKFIGAAGTKSQSFPYIQIAGTITRQTYFIHQLSTIYVDNMLKKLPSNASFLGIVINSSHGSLAQAHIIRTKLKLLSQHKNIKIFTFVQDSAVNAGFLLATSGQKIFTDSSSIIGGLEVSAQKLILGDLIQRITYKNEPSIGSEMNHLKEIDPSKKQQVQRVFEVFSKQAENQIRESRKVNENVNLGELYTASQAKELGLIDDFGRVNQMVPKVYPSLKLTRLTESSFERMRNDLRKLNIW